MLAITDTVITGSITAVLGFMTTIFTGVMTYYMAKLNIKQAAAAVKVEEAASLAKKVDAKVDVVAVKAEEAKKTLEVNTAEVGDKLNGLQTVALESKKIAVDTHTLVNSNFGVQLKLNRDLSHRIASSPDATEEDKKIADLAETVYQEHLRKQAVVDAGVPVKIEGTIFRPKEKEGE
jgi:hypothetical protein